MKLKASLFAIAALLSGAACTHEAPVRTDLAGVWANKDCELLRTERFALFFERGDSLVTATLHRMDPSDTVLLGKVVFSRDSVLSQYVLTEGDAQQPVDPGTAQADGRLRVRISGREQLLDKIEDITVTQPYEMLKASPLEIGSCIQQWRLGTLYEYDGKNVYFEGGTNRHSYTFSIMPDMIYCRAARLKFNDHGGLFDQNIRLMSNSGEHTCYTAKDNRATSAAPLIIDNSRFSPDRCVFADEGIYWSFIRFDGNTAEINGCGETYRFERPDINDPYMTEWIAFKKYE